MPPFLKQLTSLTYPMGRWRGSVAVYKYEGPPVSSGVRLAEVPVLHMD